MYIVMPIYFIMHMKLLMMDGDIRKYSTYARIRTYDAASFCLKRIDKGYLKKFSLTFISINT